MKLSEVFWKAANEYLEDGADALCGRCYTCCGAVLLASSSERMEYRAKQFMRECGMHMDMAGFDEFEFGQQRQGARYLTLMFFALVAEEEGL